MAIAFTESSHHPGPTSGDGVLWFARRVGALLDDVAAAPLSTLTNGQLAEAIRLLDSASSRVRALLAETVGEAQRRDLASAPGGGSSPAPSLVAWLKTLGPAMSHREARDLVALGSRLVDHSPTRAALAEGTVRPEQAEVIIAAVEALPAQLSVEEKARAERHLVVEAAHHPAQELKVLGKHLHEVVDPEGADEILARQLETEERRAARATKLTMWDDGEGVTHGRFRLPTLQAHMLKVALHAITNPALPDAIDRNDPEGRTIAGEEILGQAFCRLLENLPPEGLPITGGVNATVLVTIPLETLEGRLKAAELLGAGHRLSPGAARRLACQAGVIPAVLGSRSRVLDLGRRSRLHSKAQRTALAVEQRGSCGIAECDTPTAWADAHHVTGWARGGPTTLDNGVLLCPRHHTLTHTHETTHRLERTPRGWQLRRRQ